MTRHWAVKKLYVCVECQCALEGDDPCDVPERTCPAQEPSPYQAPSSHAKVHQPKYGVTAKARRHRATRRGKTRRFWPCSPRTRFFLIAETSGAVGFSLSNLLIRLPSDLATLSGAVMARRPEKTVPTTGRGPPERARLTVPEDFTKPLKMRVYGRPVSKGVEDAKWPNFGL